MIEFKEATIEAGLSVLAHIRVEQAKTIEKLGVNATDLLTKAIRNEFPSFCVFVDGIPGAIFGGHSDSLLGETRLWMLTTPLIEKHQVPLLRYSRRYVQWAFANYGPVIGVVDSDFDKSRQWLRWIGFKEISEGEYIVMRYSGGH